MRHEIKIDTPYLDAVLEGRKTFEIRLNDRGYNAGDEVLMTESVYPYRKVLANIVYVTSFAQQANHVVFGIQDVKEIKS